MKKKILHLLALGGIGGIESQCADLARYSEEEEHFYFLWGGGVNAEKIKCCTDRVVVRGFKCADIVREYLVFDRYVRTNRIEYVIVQGVSPVMLLFAGILKKTLQSTRLILYLHANAEDLFKKRYILALFRWVSAIADGHIAISRSVKQSLEGICRLDKVTVIYNGTDYKRFDHIRKYDIDRPIQMIFIGRIVRVKGIDLLIDALSNVRYPFALSIIGDGAAKEELIDLVKRSKMQQKICFVGPKPDIEKWLAKADLFVHPARWNEGFGITLIEAMSSGIPCVAFRRGAIPEIIEDGLNGYLVDEVSVEGLRDKLDHIILQRITDPQKFITISQEAKRRAKEFDIHVYAQNVSRYLEML